MHMCNIAMTIVILEIDPGVSWHAYHSSLWIHEELILVNQNFMTKTTNKDTRTYTIGLHTIYYNGINYQLHSINVSETLI